MGYYVFNPFTKKPDWTEEASAGTSSFASLWASTASFSSITTSWCNLNKDIWKYQNLVMAPNVSFASAKVDINADAMRMVDTTGNPIYCSTVDLTVTLSISGVSGLMGSAEASSQWYHFWGISNGVNFTAIADSSDDSPTMPSGYTFKCYLGAAYNDSSGNIVDFKQIDNKVVDANVVVLNNGTATSWTAVSLATVVPSTAKLVSGYVTTFATNVGVGLASTPNGYGTTFVKCTSGAFFSPYTLQIFVEQTVYYLNGSAGGSAYLNVTGFDY